MNILIFVMTMLMLLALMTYARLDSFRSSQAFQTIFQYYMENKERAYFNLQAESTYKSIVVSTKEGGAKAGPKAEGSPRIGIALLIDKTQREAKPKEWLQTQVLLKNLIISLYKDQPFFKSAIAERSSLPDDLIAAITQASDALPKEKKLKSADDLANLHLTDPQLDQLLYKLLHGIPSELITPMKKKKEKIEEEKPVVDPGKGDSTKEDEKEEFNSIKGYYSLLDFVTTKSTPKVRVYLARKEVLNAIFHDPKIVESLLTERKELYKQTKDKSDIEIKELTTTFKDHFNRLKDSSIDDNSLNYTVTKTNPKDYE